MRKLTLILCLAFATLLSAIAQTNNSVITTNLTDSFLSGAIKNIDPVFYGSYCPHANQFGFGAMLIYNVNNLVGTGVVIDWSGHASIASGTFTFKVPVHPFSFMGWTNVTMYPNALVAAGSAVSGAGQENGDLYTAEGVGASFDIVATKIGNFGAGYEYINRQNAGPLNGSSHLLFIRCRIGEW